MPDLRRLTLPFLDDPLLAPTPVDELARRSRRGRNRRLGLGAGALIVVGTLVGGLVITRDRHESSTVRTRPYLSGPIPSLNRPEAMAVDQPGRPLIWNQGTHQILRLTTDGRLEVVAGNGRHGDQGGRGRALEAEFGDFGALAVSGDGTIFFADGEYHRVRAIAPDGSIRTVAGTGSSEASGDGGQATDAGVPYPYAIAGGPDGRLWIADSSGLRYVSTDGTIHTFLAAGPDKLVLDDGTSMLFSPNAIAVDTSGDLWVYNSAPKVLVKLTPNGTVIAHWDLYVAPAGLAAVPGGGVAIANYGGFSVERVTGTTLTTVIAPNPTAELRGFRPTGVAVGPDGTIYATADGVSGGNRLPAIVRVDTQGLHQLR